MKKNTIAIPSAVVDLNASTDTDESNGLITRIGRRVVLSIFEKFTIGQLIVKLPDGSTLNYGSKKTTIENAPVTLFIHSNKFFKEVLLNGEIGFGESYMHNLWSTDNLPGILECLINNFETIPGMAGSKNKMLAFNLFKRAQSVSHWLRRNTKRNSVRNIREHYDLSNAFYALWLDNTRTYSSALFKDLNNPEESLHSAQERKYDRLCRKLELKKGMHLLEIGCGWGGFSIYAAKTYQVKVTAITISKAQFEEAQTRIQKAGLSTQIDLKLCDYRDLKGQYDAICSIEMLEAVGHEFLPVFFKKCQELLNPAGRMALQVINCPDSRYEIMRKSADWIKKHIFPGGQLPSISAILSSINQTGDLYLHHLESFGLHYSRTLRHWRKQFNSEQHAVHNLGFDDTFMRKWNYYLAYCEAAFSTRNINVCQLVLSKPNNLSFEGQAFGSHYR